MRMIGCVSPPSGGELTILGLDPARDGPAIRARLGVVPQEDTLDVELTVRENLLIYGRYFGLRRDVIAERTAKLLEFVQLTERADDQVEPLSGGMKRRLTIARSLISEPEILLLDEPTTGLDPQARHVVWDRLYRLKQQGVTLVLTTHYMDEAEQLCDRLVVMDGGKIAAEGSPRELIARYSTPEVLELRFAFDEQEHAPDKLADLPVARMEVLADRILLYAAGRRRGARPRSGPGAWSRRPRWSAEHPGGRVPPADRPSAGGLMAAVQSRCHASARALVRDQAAQVLAGQLPPDLAGVDLLERAEPGALPRRDGPRPRPAGRPAQHRQPRRRQLPGLPGPWPAGGRRHADRDRGVDLPDHSRRSSGSRPTRPRSPRRSGRSTCSAGTCCSPRSGWS